jgi:hypothetical protein
MCFLCLLILPAYTIYHYRKQKVSWNDVGYNFRNAVSFSHRSLAPQGWCDITSFLKLWMFICVQVKFIGVIHGQSIPQGFLAEGLLSWIGN